MVQQAVDASGKLSVRASFFPTRLKKMVGCWMFMTAWLGQSKLSTSRTQRNHVRWKNQRFGSVAIPSKSQQYSPRSVDTNALTAGSIGIADHVFKRRWCQRVFFFANRTILYQKHESKTSIARGSKTARPRRRQNTVATAGAQPTCSADTEILALGDSLQQHKMAVQLIW